MIGSLVGGYVFGLLDIFAYGLLGRLVIATAGAIMLIALLRYIKREKQ